MNFIVLPFWKLILQLRNVLNVLKDETSSYVLPVGRWGVVKGIICSLHLVIKYNRTLFQSFSQQILPYDHNSDSGTSDILLCTCKYQPELGARQSSTNLKPLKKRQNEPGNTAANLNPKQWKLYPTFDTSTGCDRKFDDISLTRITSLVSGMKLNSMPWTVSLQQ